MAKKLSIVLILAMLLSLLTVSALAGAPYQVLIQDDAGLIAGQEAEVRAAMEPIAAQYANVLFLSSDAATSRNVENIAEDALKSRFGSDSAVVFYVDLYQRELTFYSIGEAYKAIGSRGGRSIADNVYTLASRGDYAGCAVSAYTQALRILEGGRVTAPAQHVTNALGAILIGFLIVYIYVVKSRVPKKKIDPSLYNANYDKKTTTAAAAAMASVPAAILLGSRFLRTSRVTKSSSSGGGGGGGGGHSGGGGSHRF